MRENQYSGKQWISSMRVSTRGHKGIRREFRPSSEIHPESDRIAVLIDSVNVRMPHARQQPSFPNHRRGRVGTSKNLQRNFSLETRIPCDVYAAETSVADRPANFQAALGESCERQSIRVGGGGRHPGAIRRGVSSALFGLLAGRRALQGSRIHQGSGRCSNSSSNAER